ncbi:MAG: sigma-70 family RNA polymerase sigma factor, partial [Planctomycetaceae bacterium]
RVSLLIRLRDRGNREAWQEFVEIYRPVIWRLAVLKGLQDSDAHDLVQQVLMSVARSIDRWKPDPERARFRTWLNRVAENAILSALNRRRPDQGSGDSDVQAILESQASDNDPETGLLRLEYRREVFRWAARQIRREFQDQTWQAFWLSAVDGWEVERVARHLGKNSGSIYAARSRVMRRLQEKIAEYEG